MEDTTTLTFRLPLTVKKTFEEACKQADQTPSQVLRAAIREYLAEHRQPDLLATPRRRK